MAQAGPVSSPSGRFPALAKYEIQEELGHGGMATVYRAHDARLGRDVAIKVLHPHLRDNREIAHRFATEAKAVAKLRHPNIVEVFDVSEVGDGERYLVVELVRGTTLRAIIAERGALPPEIAAAIALEVLAALSAAHGEGVVHRDVKPENVLMEHPHLRRHVPSESLVPRSNPNDTQLRIKLTDFGIAKLLDAQGVTSTGQVLGSPAHMAPEQIDGGDVDERADVFGMGVLLYECMVGHLPFEGANPAQVLRRVLDGTYNPAERDRPIVGRDWSRLIDRALMLDPKERFESAIAMREAIQAQFKLLGVDDPRKDLEDYFRDPEGYDTAHTATLLARLQELGAEARKKRDVQGAANAYNRALAYAPNDTQLLRVVATLARAEDRRRMLKRGAGPVALVVLLGLVAFGVTRFVTAQRVQKQALPQPSAQASVVTSSAKLTPSATTPEPRASAPKPRNITVAAPQLSAKKEPTKIRSLTFGSIEPENGVLCSVDGTPAKPVTEGLALTATDGSHQLAFSCVNDMCEPQKRAIEAGEKDENVSIIMTIRPAIITVEGPATGVYGIRQKPTITLRPGVPTKVPISGGGSEALTVIERGSGKTVSVNARAGAESKAEFTDLVP
jgi:serine/threonine-protein kinase